MKSNWSNESRHKRGYGNAWDKLRKVIMQRDSGMCQCELCMGRKLRANEVHHIVSKERAKQLGWTAQEVDNPSNLQAVNAQCHKRITLAEQGKVLKPKVKFGIDGYPIGIE